MIALLYLLPAALLLGLAALLAFIWSLGHGQFDDLDGDGTRILFDGQTRKQAAEGGEHAG